MIVSKEVGKSGGGPPQSKTRGVGRRLANLAKRHGVRQPSGALFGTTFSRDLPPRRNMPLLTELEKYCDAISAKMPPRMGLGLSSA